MDIFLRYMLRACASKWFKKPVATAWMSLPNTTK